MYHVLWLIPGLPLFSFLLLALGSGRLSRRAVAAIGCASIGLSAVLAIAAGIQFLVAPPEGYTYIEPLWTWMQVGDFAPSVSLRLDSLSVTMSVVVAFVSFWIHLYSVEFMADDAGYARFFAYMNLFVASMLTLVLAEDLLLLYLGWEGVGLCSYLLIGFWYEDPANGRAARKAFIVTRIGDTAMAIGLLLLFWQLGTLDVGEILARAPQQWAVGSPMAIAAAALLLGGALGKSAQVPLQTWLPDAMAGPTPTSALIHAATMVTAGVYLIARMHVLYELAPPVQAAVAVIGAVTLFIAACSALVQSDIKRALAYSTISQIGYMFLALGVGAWSAAIFHFMTHAFFKALLFLAAGAVILAQHHEHNMFRMGGLRRELPVTFWTFLIGAASLASLPLVTAGFYSKEAILTATWLSEKGGTWLWAVGLITALLTAIYSFRIVFLTFYGDLRQPITHRPRWTMHVPLVVLAAFSIGAGFVNTPPVLGNVDVFSRFLASSLPAGALRETSVSTQVLLIVAASAASLLGIFVAWLVYLRSPGYAAAIARTAWGSLLDRFWLVGWGFDWVYDRLLVRPYVALAQLDRNDFIDLFYSAVALINVLLNRVLSRTQTGRLRWYAMGLAIGAVILGAIVVFR